MSIQIGAVPGRHFLVDAPFLVDHLLGHLQQTLTLPGIGAGNATKAGLVVGHMLGTVFSFTFDVVLLLFAANFLN